METLKRQEYDEVFVLEVDPQNDFMEYGALPVNQGSKVVEKLNDLRGWAFNQNGMRLDGIGRVYISRDWHPEQTAHFKKWPVHCVAKTKGADFHEDLNTDGAIIVSKGMSDTDDEYSAVQAVDERGTSIADEIRLLERRKKAVLVGGLATDYCVKASVLDLLGLGDDNLDVYLVTNAIKAVNINPDDGENAINEMLEAGAIAIETDQIVFRGLVGFVEP